MRSAHAHTPRACSEQSQHVCVHVHTVRREDHLLAAVRTQYLSLLLASLSVLVCCSSQNPPASVKTVSIHRRGCLLTSSARNTGAFDATVLHLLLPSSNGFPFSPLFRDCWRRRRMTASALPSSCGADHWSEVKEQPYDSEVSTRGVQRCGHSFAVQ